MFVWANLPNKNPLVKESATEFIKWQLSFKMCLDVVDYQMSTWCGGRDVNDENERETSYLENKCEDFYLFFWFKGDFDVISERRKKEGVKEMTLKYIN